jgi:hypothetical protein
MSKRRDDPQRHRISFVPLALRRPRQVSHCPQSPHRVEMHLGTRSTLLGAGTPW